MTMMQTFTSRPSLAGHILRRGRVAAVLAAALLAGASVPVPAMAVEEGTPWEVDTVDGSLGSGRQNYDYAVEPGERLEDALTVVNNGSTPIDLALYAADAFTTDTGRLDLRTRDDAPTGVGGWLQLDRDRISLQPGESAEVPFALTVPGDASPGSHMGGIVTTPASTSSGTEPERRVAIRIHLRVGESFRPSLSVEDVSVDYSGDSFGTGRAIVTYTIRNTGDTMLAAEQSVVVAGPFDAFRVTADPVDDAPLLLPDETWTVSVPVRGVAPVGLLAATVTLVPLYTDPAGSTGPLAMIEHTGHGWAIPWLPAMLILCLAALVAVLVARKRRRPGPQETLPQDAGTVAHAHEPPGV
jgi:WxL Interacting Protein, peptidoglycan binding domain